MILIIEEAKNVPGEGEASPYCRRSWVVAQANIACRLSKH